MLAAFGFKVKCTDTDCTVETPIKTHHHQVAAIWNRRASPDREQRADDIHSCSFYCERAACIKAQRDEMRERLELDAVDAARYRWLRAQSRPWTGWYSLEALDSKIDAATTSHKP